MKSNPKTSSNASPLGVLAGGGASPASNLLCLTINRTSPHVPKDIPIPYLLISAFNSQQRSDYVRTEFQKEKARKKRKELSKQKFRMRIYPSGFCDSLKVTSFDIENSKVKFVNNKPTRCKSWSCPNCAVGNARRVRFLIEKVVLLNDLEYFFTLTLDPEKIPVEYKDNTHKYVTLLYNKLMLYLKRECKFQTPLKYVWVMEYQKNGNAHMHGMWNQRVDVNVLRRIWLSIGGGQQMYLSKARDLTRTARYVSKYLSKAFNSSRSDFYFFQKRYAISNNCVRGTKRPAISSVYVWEDLVYHSYFLAKDHLLPLVSDDDKTPSFSFNFFEPDEIEPEDPT